MQIEIKITSTVIHEGSYTPYVIAEVEAIAKAIEALKNVLPKYDEDEKKI